MSDPEPSRNPQRYRVKVLTAAGWQWLDETLQRTPEKWQGRTWDVHAEARAAMQNELAKSDVSLAEVEIFTP